MSNTVFSDTIIFSPVPGEIPTHDNESQRDAINAFTGDAEILGYRIENVKSSRLKEATIVRLDLFDKMNGRLAGHAIRIVSGKQILLKIHIV
jgi:hypothetical protein